MPSNLANITIGVVCPGRALDIADAEELRSFVNDTYGGRLRLKFHPQCFLKFGHFAGADDVRSDAFKDFANDPEIDAIWFGRGGYGAMRLDAALFGKLGDAARNKLYVGYSDAGTLLARLYREQIGAPVHGPMPIDFTRENGPERVRRALDFMAANAPPGKGGHLIATPGLAPQLNTGAPAAAFNITILAHLVGTSYMPDLADHVVMLEEVDEHLYAIDRSLFAIFEDAGVKRAKGVMLGSVTGVPENDIAFGAGAEEIVKHWCTRAGVAYLGRASVGHDANNYVVPFGRRMLG